MAGKRVNVLLICGGKYHDFDFARLELLKLCHEHERIRVRVAEDYSAVRWLESTDVLVTYTCDVVPNDDEQAILAGWLASGKRWFALHGTNSIIEWLSFDPVKVGAPDTSQDFMALLGSQFLAHPPVGEFRVEVSAPSHPLVAGIEPFDTTDELYLSRYYGETTPLLHCHFQGTVEDFDHSDWPSDDPHLVFYLHPVESGEVLYLTLGHCRGRYDMQPLMDIYPQVERCSWELPVYYELLRRGIRWAIGEL